MRPTFGKTNYIVKNQIHSMNHNASRYFHVSFWLVVTRNLHLNHEYADTYSHIQYQNKMENIIIAKNKKKQKIP